MEKRQTFSTNVAGKIGYPHVEPRNKIPVFHPVSKSTQNESETLTEALKL
jgi:hypothetical protein